MRSQALFRFCRSRRLARISLVAGLAAVAPGLALPGDPGRRSGGGAAPAYQETGLPSGQDSEDGPAPPATAEAALATLRALEENYREAHRLYAAKVLPMREGVKRDKAQRLYYPRPETWAKRFLRACSRVPGSEAEALAWGWVVLHAGQTEYGPAAAAGLIEKHLASPHLAHLCEPDSVATEKQLAQVFEGSPLGGVRALAGLELADRLLSPGPPRAAVGAGGRSQAPPAEQGWSQAQIEARQQRAVALLETLEAGLAGVRVGDRPVPEIAADRLYAWRKLRPGMPAPSITGTDLTGKPLASWDTEPCRARVLVFWRTREMGREPGYGALRTLDARFSHRGVRLAGINGDRDVARAARAAKLQRMPMPSLADGAQGGAASLAYRNETWPNAVLLDGQGRIVRRGLGLGELPGALDAYLDALEPDARKD